MEQRAVIYTRVSTEDQKENGFSLPDQENKLRSYCTKQGIPVLAHFQDDHSAKDFSRPEFQRFLSELKAGKLKPNLFLCVRIDRFSRNMAASLEMIKFFREQGITFRTLENNYELDNPESLIPYVLNMLLPQVENERRGLNTKAGMRQAVKEGRWLWQAPKGYDNDRATKMVVINKEEAPYIKEAFESFAKGAFSADEIRKSLIQKGFSCSKQQFLNLLKNPFYTGFINIPAWKNEPEQTVRGLHEPLIDEATFQKVQNILTGKKKYLSINSTRTEPLPLRGFLLCKVCGSKLTGSGSKGRDGTKHFYYHCQNGCKERFRADIANQSFSEYLASFKVPDEVLSLYWHILQDVFSVDEEKKAGEIKHLDNQISAQKQRLEALEDKFVDDLIDQGTYKRNKVRYEESLNELLGQHGRLFGQTSNFSKYINYGFSLLSNLDSYYDSSPLKVKQKMIGSIFPEKLIFEDKKYRNTRLNEVLSLLAMNINELEGFKKEKVGKNTDLSTLAPLTSQFSNRLMDDLQKLYELEPFVQVIDIDKRLSRNAIAV